MIRTRMDDFTNETGVLIQYRPGLAWPLWCRWLGKLLGRHAWACTDFPDVGPPVVSLDYNLPVRHVPEVLAHELAHVAVGYDQGHGEEWWLAFTELIEASQRIYDEVADAYD